MASGLEREVLHDVDRKSMARSAIEELRAIVTMSQ